MTFFYLYTKINLREIRLFKKIISFDHPVKKCVDGRLSKKKIPIEFFLQREDIDKIHSQKGRKFSFDGSLTVDTRSIVVLFTFLHKLDF